MAQLTDDCFAFGGALVGVATALEDLLGRLAPVTQAEELPLRRALGRFLAADVTSDRAVPPHDNSAVDGYCVYFDDLDPRGEVRLPVAGRAAAGHPLPAPQPRGTAVRIFTGAPMPRGADGGPGPDTVLMQEDCRIDADRVVIPRGIKRAANRRKAGEDVVAGARILAAGRRLRAQDLGLAASIGRTSLSVRQPLRAAVFSTGDEIREPGIPLPEGCVYDANRTTLVALLEGMGCRVTDLGILADEPGAVRQALAAAASGHDLIMTSGGVSGGEEDHVRGAVESLGTLHFWRLAIKPGRPVALGQVDRVPFFGLPGNPVAAMVTFLSLARPLVLRLAGSTEPAPRTFPVRADFAYAKKAGRREFVRVRLEADEGGGWKARKFARDGAGILSSMVEADGIVSLPEDLVDLVPGAAVDFLPFAEAGL